MGGREEGVGAASSGPLSLIRQAVCGTPSYIKPVVAILLIFIAN